MNQYKERRRVDIWYQAARYYPRQPSHTLLLRITPDRWRGHTYFSPVTTCYPGTGVICDVIPTLWGVAWRDISYHDDGLGSSRIENWENWCNLAGLSTAVHCVCLCILVIASLFNNVLVNYWSSWLIWSLHICLAVIPFYLLDKWVRYINRPKHQVNQRSRECICAYISERFN